MKPETVWTVQNNDGGLEHVASTREKALYWMRKHELSKKTHQIVEVEIDFDYYEGSTYI